MARLREVSGLSQAVALTRPSVIWLNLQSSLRENRPPWIDIAYPGLRHSKLGCAHCRIKMVDGTDNQENAEKKPALCFTRYTQANILRILSSTSCLKKVFGSTSAVIKIFFMTDNDDRQNRLLNPACAYARGVIKAEMCKLGMRPEG